MKNNFYEHENPNYKIPGRKLIMIFLWFQGRKGFIKTQKVLSIKERVDYSTALNLLIVLLTKKHHKE